MAIEIVGEEITGEAEAEQTTEIEISVRPLPKQHIVRVKLPRRLFDDRARSASLQGSQNVELDVALPSIVEAGERFDGRPVVEVDTDSLICERRHDGVDLAAIVMFMPEVRDPNNLTNFAHDLERWVRSSGPVTSIDVMEETERLIQERRKDTVLTDRAVQDGDLVVLDAWNTGLGKDAKARIIVRVGEHNADLSNALLDKLPGHSLIGAYPIETLGRSVKAQKIELIGIVQTGQYGTAELCRDLEIAPDRLEAFVRLHIDNNLPVKATSWLVKWSAAVEIDPLPINVIGQIAGLAANAEIERDGPATTMRRYGVESHEALIDALIEFRIGTLVRTEVVLFWLAHRMWGTVPEDVLRAYCGQHKIPNRAMALLQYGRERIVKHAVDLMRKAREVHPLDQSWMETRL